MSRVYNFSAGPSMMFEQVLKTAQSELMEYGSSGQSVMEMSHRSSTFDAIIKDTEARLRRVLSIPDNYKVGFIQGGASTQFDKKTYEPIDAIDSLSTRPDFTGLVYPAYCDKPGNDLRWSGKPLRDADYNSTYAIAENLNVTKDTPPAFIVQTQDDFYANAAIAYYLALKKNKVPANLHMFDKGGHGYGLNNKADLVSEWKDLYEEWLEHNNFDGEKR